MGEGCSAKFILGLNSVATWFSQSERTCCHALVLSAIVLSFAPGMMRSFGTEPQPIRAAASYHITRWTTDDGLPQNRVNCLLQTRDGYLWLGTWAGLVRFDGMKFRVFDRFNTPAFVKDAVNSLAEDEEGTLWIATNDGLVRRRGGEFTRLTERDGLPDSKVWEIKSGPMGRLWIRAGDLIVEFQAGRFTVLGSRPPNHDRFRNLLLAPDQRLGVVTDNGFWIAAADRSSLVPWIPKAPTSNEVTLAVITDKGRTIWAASEAGVFRYTNGVWERSAAAPGVSWQRPPNLYGDRQGNFWAGFYQHGLHLWTTNQFSEISLGAFPSPPDVTAMADDFEGNLWVGTTDGLFCLTRKLFHSFTSRDGLLSDNVWSISPASRGGVWVGTDADLNLIRDGHVSLASDKDRGSGEITTVWEDRKGVVWFARKYRAPFIIPNGDASQVALFPKLIDSVGALYEDGDGTLFFGTEKGLVRHRTDGALDRLEGVENLPKTDVRTILRRRDGTLWLGTYGGGVVQVGSRQPWRQIWPEVEGNQTRANSAVEASDLRVFSASDGLADGRAWALHEDADGAVWIGTENGLTRMVTPQPSSTNAQPRFTTFRREQGLFENLVNQVLEDDFGNLWLSGLRGIHRISRADLNAVAERRSKRVHCVTFGIADGMESAETNGERQPAGCKTPDGRLWFPTVRGVVMIDPRELNLNARPPPVVIEQVKADDEVVYGDDVAASVKARANSVGGSSQSAPSPPQLQLAPGRARVIEFYLTALSLTAPEKNRFSWRLDGVDLDWSEPTTRRVATYTTLKPGAYRFHVRAANNHNVWSERDAEFAFTLAPHFWQTWPFFAACTAGIIGLAAGIQAYRLRVQRRILRLEQEAALQGERARIAKDLHDDLGATLTGMALQVDVAKRNARQPEVLETQLDNIARSTRGLVEKMRETVWAVNPECDTLESLVDHLCQFAENFLSTASVRCRLDVPVRLPALGVSAELRHNLFLALKEALNNVVKHAGATEVWLRFQVGDGTLTLTIQDDGRGFAPEVANGNGNGVGNLHNRMRLLNGRLELRSAPGHGTQLVFEVPL